MQVTLNIPDQYFAAFLEHVRQLEYVDIADNQDLDAFNVPEEHKRIILERLNEPEEYSDWETVKARITRK